jgi:hypothetical protein
MFNNVKTAVTEYKATLKELKSKLRSEFLEKLKIDCNELKDKFPELEHIFVLGYTPEWNDGEECTHSSEVFISKDAPRAWDTVDEYVERLYWRDESECPEAYKNSNQNLSLEDAKAIKDILYNAQFEDGLNEVLETNFNIVIDFTGETVEVNVSYYECGH